MGANESVPNDNINIDSNATCECGLTFAEGGCGPASLSLMNKLSDEESNKDNAFNSKLLNTVKHYHRHIILCDGMMDWEPKIHQADGSFAQRLIKEIGNRENDLLPASAQELAEKQAKKDKKKMKKGLVAGGESSGSGGGSEKEKKKKKEKTNDDDNDNDNDNQKETQLNSEQSTLQSSSSSNNTSDSTTTPAFTKQSNPLVTACSERSKGEGMDILVYPENIRYVGVTLEQVPLFVEWQVVQGKVCPTLKTEPIGIKHLVLVCTHDSRDKRCGRIGPQVMKKLQDILEEKGVGEETVAVRGSSHLGGHKYAGVIVIYPHGDWYGYMTERNAEKLVDAYLTSNPSDISQYWRGSMS